VRLQKLQADLIGGLLAAFYSALNQMGFDSGQEFIVALQEAKALNANIVLGDQPIDITLQRLQQALAVSDLSKMFSPPDSMNEVEIEVAQALNSGSKAELAGAVELLKQRSQVRELVAVMKQQLPEVYQALLAERDSYMANSLRNSPGQRIVGVVGIAHMDGIEKKLGYERINC
jgi:pheromone shutdown protein TraB